MAIGARGAHVPENQAGVAFHAANLGMHSPQRESGGIVIEFGIRPNRLPACICVAALARSRNRAMRIRDLRLRPTYLVLGLGGAEQRRAKRETQQKPGQDTETTGEVLQNSHPPNGYTYTYTETREMVYIGAFCMRTTETRSTSSRRTNINNRNTPVRTLDLLSVGNGSKAKRARVRMGFLPIYQAFG